MRGNKPSKKKKLFGIKSFLKDYLVEFKRWIDLPIHYDDMLRYIASYPLLNAKGEDTLWETVVYQESDREDIYNALCHLYALLKTDGDIGVIEHLTVDRIDFCVVLR